jgi:N-acetylmuramoyl-L-alanine amidase
VGHTNNVTHVGGDDFVDLVRWRQESNGVVVYTIGLKPGRKIWGWHGRFDGTKLRVDVRRPLKSNRKRPLEGWKIMLDPGHMPSAPGATGPLATKEMDANIAIAQVTAELLRKEGALPILTRSSSTDEVSLTDRPKLALEQGADLFISIHNNALPDGSNPFSKARGFSVYYYHPQSLALARAIHDSYIKNIPLADDGLLWGNLLVARLSAVPSILIENAYLLYPEQQPILV